MSSEYDSYYVNGTRVQFSTCKALYFVDNSILRHIPDPTTYLNLFIDWEGIVNEKEPEPCCSFGKPIFPGACLKQNKADRQIYLVEGTVKRAIPDDLIDKFHFAREKIELADSETLAELIDGSPVIPVP